MPEVRSPANDRLFRAAGGSSVLGIVIAALFAVANQPPITAPLAVEASAQGWADESRCIACHDQALTFWETGHAQTLQPATAPDSRKLLAKLVGAEGPLAEQTTIRATADRLFAITHTDGREIEVELDWCFGSGAHAATWASTIADSSGAIDELEFRWSVYAGDVVDITPGQPETPLPGRHGKLGVWYDSPKAYRCFSCHASVLPVTDGAIAEEHIKAGVTCQRCHGPRGEHVASAGQGGHAQWPRSRMESVNRCAQCHRRADELPPQDVHPGNRDIVRFQPAGLVQSRCFTESAKMDCMTCHDPHKPLHAQDSLGLWQCIQCHDPRDDSHVLCGAGESDKCLKCHMPAVEMDAPLSFTDHWIRVREPGGE